jgi:hypothetical protein
MSQAGAARFAIPTTRGDLKFCCHRDLREPAIIARARPCNDVSSGSLSLAQSWVPAFAGSEELHQPRLVERGLDERAEQRVRLERAGFEFRVELHADKPRVLRDFDDLRQQAVGRHAGET